MIHPLIIAAIIIALLYIFMGYNNREMPLWQYVLIFVIVVVLAKMVMDKQNQTTETMTSYQSSCSKSNTNSNSVMDTIEAIPSKLMDMVGVSTPKCYNVPFKVLNTQYGDKALLAGYNEMVQPYQTGAAGLYEPPFRGSGSTSCDQIGYSAQPVNN